MLMSLVHVMSPSTISRHQNKSAFQRFDISFLELLYQKAIHKIPHRDPVAINKLQNSCDLSRIVKTCIKEKSKERHVLSEFSWQQQVFFQFIHVRHKELIKRHKHNSLKPDRKQTSKEEK